jgi:hypothetical protein
VAQQEAARIHAEAESAARETRDDAVARSQEHVGPVRGAPAEMLERVSTMETELTGLVESLRTGANRLGADLSLLEDNMSELYDAAGTQRPAVPRPVESVPLAAVPGAPEPDSEPEAASEEAATVPGEVEPAMDDAVPAASGDVEGARLVALNMALNGTPREETDQYLADNFDLADRATLLDEVYATVET